MISGHLPVFWATKLFAGLLSLLKEVFQANCAKGVAAVWK
jgi:hypothetical protein